MKFKYLRIAKNGGHYIELTEEEAIECLESYYSSEQVLSGKVAYCYETPNALYLKLI